MVYTVTLNPALDHIVFVSDLTSGGLNKMNRDVLNIGGKGINVSVMLSEFHVKSKALGFVAGFTGDEIERRLRGYGIDTDLVHLESGNSRINIKLMNYAAESFTETEINSDGPEISDKALSEFFKKLSVIEDGDILVLAGGVPHTLQKNIYEQIMEYVSGRSVKVVVDAAGELLTSTLKYSPFLIKPNLEELGAIFGEKPSSKVEAIAYAKHLQEMGAQNVLVSMAGEGAILLDENGKTLYCAACRGKVRNSFGAGSAMLAGFLSATLDNDTDMEYALMLGTAAGGATVFSDGLAKKADILDQMKKLLKDHAEKSI